MIKQSKIIIVFSACVFSLTAFWACDSKKEPPPKAIVIKKKIVPRASQKNRSKTRTGRQVAARSKKARMQPKADIAKTTAPVRVARKPAAKSSAAVKPADAQPVASNPGKSGPVAARPGLTKSAPRQMAQTSDSATQSAFNPKSDIAVAAKRPTQKTPVARNKPEAQPEKVPAVKPKTASGGPKVAANRQKPVTRARKTKPPIEPSKAEPKAGGEPPPYNPIGKLNPFEPLFKDQPAIPASKKKRKKRVPRTPLERIALSQLKLTGIIQASSGNRALVQESSGKGYIIKRGTYIGLNAGKVTEIRGDVVIIEEEVENVMGKVSTRQKKLKLPKPPGE